MAEQSLPPDWEPPPIMVKWGHYFTPGAEEQKPVVDMVMAAKNGGLVDQRKAVEAVAQIFGIENIEAYLQTLKKEQTESDAREVKKTGDMAKATAQGKPKPDGKFGA